MILCERYGEGKVLNDLTMLFLLQDSNLEGSPRHSLGSNNSSNLSTPPSPARELGSSSYSS